MSGWVTQDSVFQGLNFPHYPFTFGIFLKLK